MIDIIRVMSRIIIDVREPEEFAAGHIDGALNISANEFLSGTNKLDGIDKDSEIIVYCRSGSRSNVAMQYLKQMGYHNVINGINQDQVKAKYL